MYIRRSCCTTGQQATSPKPCIARVCQAYMGLAHPPWALQVRVTDGDEEDGANQSANGEKVKPARRGGETLSGLQWV